MARASMIAKEKRRVRLCEQYVEKRKELKRLVIDPQQSEEVRLKAMLRLQQLPKDSSKTRLRNRCAMTGRARGYLRRFGLCRIKVREMASKGEIPGIRMASW